MMKRPIFITFVVVTLLLSAWGNVIAAAFCPRLALDRACCEKHAAHKAKPKPQSSCHHQMGEMEMADMQMEADDPAPAANPQSSVARLGLEVPLDQFALHLPLTECDHCLSHSQTTSGTVSLVTIDPSNRLLGIDARPVNFGSNLTPALAVLNIATAHGPPGPSSPRYVLISVFRL